MATQKGFSPVLDPKVVRKLLDKLSTDNEFRRTFKKDPKAALIASGHKVAKDDAKGEADLDQICKCLKVGRIAPKDVIVRSRDALEEQLSLAMGMSPIRLNIPDKAVRRLRK